MGNIGYATQQCYASPIDVGNIALSCSYGVIGEILDYGVNDLNAVPIGETEPHEHGRFDICMSDEVTDRCKPTHPRL
jgi:hypothetical protein